jgi:pantetheine-phosphate adenylyltransferase
MTKFKKVGVGGTFDELHRGHKVLLAKAFEVGEKVVIGLTSDAFVAKMGKPHRTSSFAARRRELQQFLEASGVAQRFQIVALDDPFGQTMDGEGLEALVVSQETQKTGDAINEKRQSRGLPPLKIVTVNMVPAENFEPISTTRIRRGEIDRNGHILASAQ